MKRTEAGKLTLALTGNEIPVETSAFHHIYCRIWIDFSTHTVLGNFCDGLSLSAGGGRHHKPATAVSPKSHKKHRTVSRGIQKNKTVMVLLFRRLLHVLSLGENKRINHEEKLKILWQFSHIKKRGVTAVRDDGSQYSSCSSCWSSGASSWACWSTSCPSPSASSALS